MSEMPTFPEGFLSCVLALGLNPLDINPTYHRTFQQFLASRDAEVARAAKVEALREAADAYNGSDDLAEFMRSWQWDQHVAFLRARANRIEAGEDAHNATTGPGAGQDGDGGASGSPSEGGADSGAQRGENA